jgi:hypothetical protein
VVVVPMGAFRMSFRSYGRIIWTQFQQLSN